MDTHNTVKERFAKILAGVKPDDLNFAGQEGLILMGIGALLAQQQPDMVDLVQRFHKKFEMEYSGPSRILPSNLFYRAAHLQEEVNEYLNAVKSADIKGQYDALLDLLFLVLGTLDQQGFNTYDGFVEVFASNMTKELVAEGKGKHGTRIHKGEAYVPPNLEQFLF